MLRLRRDARRDACLFHRLTPDLCVTVAARDDCRSTAHIGIARCAARLLRRCRDDPAIDGVLHLQPQNACEAEVYHTAALAQQGAGSLTWTSVFG